MRKRYQVCLLYFLIISSVAYSNKFSAYIDSAKMAMLNPDSSSLNYIDKAIVYAENNLEKAEALKQKGIWNYYRQFYDEALKFYRDALKCLNASNFKTVSQKANIYNNIALVQEDSGNIDSAFYYYNQSKDLRWEIHDTLGLVKIAYTNLISLSISQGDYLKALELSQTMLSLSEQSGHLEYSASAYDFAGSIFEIQENFEDAKLAYEASLSLREHIGDSLNIASSLNNLGIIYFRNKEYETALNYSLKALKIKEQFGLNSGLESTYNNLGLIYQAMDSLNRSLEMYLKSYEIGKKRHVGASLIASINITDIALEIGDIDMAYKFGKEAYENAVKISGTKNIKDAAFYLAIIKEKKKEYKEAYKYLMESLVLQDSLFNEEIVRKLTEKQLSYEYKKAAQKDSIENAEHIQSERLLYENRIGKQNFRFAVAIFSLIVIVLLAVFIITYNKNKQNIVRAKLEKKSAEIETSLLRAQMNPHFIFNSMNSIQNFISRNDSLQAEKYLAKFARLIRLILDNSAKDFVPLEDEMSLIDNYLGIESLRLDGKLSYEISISENLDTEDILIPSMLIQPYVENAILHGIIPKEGKGKIRVIIREGEDFSCLNVLVEDDGIGRTASQVKKQNIKHKSIGMHITKDRLALLSKHKKSKASVVVEDIISDKKVCGTLVKIVLPIKN